MTAITDVLARHGVVISDDELAAELDRALQDLPGAPASDTLTRAEAAFLAQHGGPGVAAQVDGFDPVRAHRGQAVAAADGAARMLGGLLTRDEAAERLGIDPSGVSRRIQDRRLWALPRSGRRIPAWQIQAGQLLPGLRTLIAALPEEVHPLSLEGLMTTEQDHLGGVTPIDFLLGGGPAEPVAELIGELDRW